MWSTGNEIDFVRRIGTGFHRKQDRCHATRRQLLERYLESTQRRADWGSVDSEKVISFARLELMTEIGG